MAPPIILSLFDATGNWSRPYREAGYDVRQYDLTLGHDLLSDELLDCYYWTDMALAAAAAGTKVRGILIAPPCTDFASSGAQYWLEKDADGRTQRSIDLVGAALAIIGYTNPDWWCLENPVGRLNRCIPLLAQCGPRYVQPFWYGDPYTKKTGLWGRFNLPAPTNMVEPQRVCAQGSWLQKLGGKSERTKALRSATPMGFARAFFAANP